MSHEHAHAHAHGHDHAHDHAHERPAAAEGGASVLMRGAGTRVAVALAALVLLWAAVAWALTDLAT
ncbi:hypothetical protein [Piscinibacter sp.]|uniref:hypothetical protein n=1 Tax=Piscinibacter sp. TaxID=1903157 RepID=UPI0035AEB85F